MVKIQIDIKEMHADLKTKLNEKWNKINTCAHKKQVYEKPAYCTKNIKGHDKTHIAIINL